MKREFIDFHSVEPAHIAVHERLLNWARWVRPGRGHTGLHPMFRQFRRTETVLDPTPAHIPIDSADGMLIEKAVIKLPDAQKGALQWHYVFPFIEVGKACRLLAVSGPGLQELVRTGRTMLKNRL